MWTVRLPLNGPRIVLWYNFPVCVLITSWYKMLMKNPIILNNLRKLYTYWNHLVNFWAFLLTRKLIFEVIDSVFFFFFRAVSTKLNPYYMKTRNFIPLFFFSYKKVSLISTFKNKLNFRFVLTLWADHSW